MEPIAILVLDGDPRPVFTPGEVANLVARGARRQVRCPSTHPAVEGIPYAAPRMRQPEDTARALLAEQPGPILRRGETDQQAADRWHREADIRAAARALLVDAGLDFPPGSPRARTDLVAKPRKRSPRRKPEPRSETA